jgi:hypothetical protein
MANSDSVDATRTRIMVWSIEFTEAAANNPDLIEELVWTLSQFYCLSSAN